MDFRKFATIALKDIYIQFTDRTSLLITIITPFVLTFVIGAAFSGFTGNSGAPVKGIRVVVVNQDQGAAFGPQQVNFGQTLTDALQKNVGDLLSVDVLTDESAAKARVVAGKAVTAVLIPADFSQALNPTSPTFSDKKITLTLFRDAGSPLSADIVASVVRQMVNSFTNANLALYAAGKAGANPLMLITQAGAIAQEVGAKSSEGLIAVRTADSAPAQQGQGINLLQYFAPAMAVFFLNFSMAFGAVSIIEERENWTLQRLLASPTNRLTILAGKLGGTYVTGVIQIATLIIATSIVAPLLGNKVAPWGTNVPALIILTLIVVAGSIGFGTMIASFARTRQQATVYVSALMTVLGLVGGTFFPSGNLGILSKITVNYWATNAYQTLAQTSDLSAVLPNMLALLVMFVVCFGIGVTLFNRRLDV
jgi:ABC-2 type transport system permease protein